MTSTGEAIFALLGAASGGVGLKILDSFLGRGRVKSDEASEIRKELRQEINGLRAEHLRIEAELDEWKQKYYDLLDKMYKQQQQLNAQNKEK